MGNLAGLAPTFQLSADLPPISADDIAPTFGLLDEKNPCEVRPYALYAKSAVTELSIAGSGNCVNGDIHTNQNLRISGDHAALKGTSETVSGVTRNGTEHTVAAQTQATAAGFPFQPDVTAIVPTYYYRGDTNLNKEKDVWAAPGKLHTGVYVCGGKLEVSGNGLEGNVTLMGATVAIKGQDVNLKAFTRGVVAYGSGDGCPIDIASERGKYQGLLYAPNGRLQVTGNHNTVRGMAMAYVIRVAGNNNTFTFEKPAGGCGTPVTQKPAPVLVQPKPAPAKPVQPKQDKDLPAKQDKVPPAKQDKDLPTKQDKKPPAKQDKDVPTKQDKDLPAKPVADKETKPTSHCWSFTDKPLGDLNSFSSVWDPKETSGDGLQFGNQKTGDFDLLRSACGDFVLQSQQGLDKYGWWPNHTVNLKLALKDGADVVVYDGSTSSPTLTINGKLWPMPTPAHPIHTTGGVTIEAVWDGVIIFTHKHDEIYLNQQPSFINVSGRLGDRKAGEIRGALGAFDATMDQSDDLLGRSSNQAMGSPNDPAAVDRFEEEWRALPGESLFGKS